MEKIITNNPNGYNEIRNIFSRYDATFLYHKDLFSYGLKLYHFLTGRGYHPFWKGLFYSLISKNLRCIFFNTINLGQNPWIVYFETTIPRLGKAPNWIYHLAIKKLAKDNCREIIAISNCAFNLQINFLKAEYPEYLLPIQKKMSVLLPPQKPLIDDYEEKELSKNRIVFTLIGTDFFRKGGNEILAVFDELLPDHPNLYLNIVSSLNYGDYATQASKDDYQNAVSVIKKYPANIKHYSRLKNEEVLGLLKNTHVGLLPTWADSFGYSVLEAQAAGCPVITTDIRALPEINNNDIGWVIPVPKLRNKNADIDSLAKRKFFREHLTESIKRTIIEVISKPELIARKGREALLTVKQRSSA